MERDGFAVSRKLQRRERQMRRVISRSGCCRKSRSHFGMVKSRLPRSMSRVKDYELASLRSRVAEQIAILRQPLPAHLMEHQGPRVISHEFFRPLVVVASESARFWGVGLLRRGRNRRA